MEPADLSTAAQAEDPCPICLDDDHDTNRDGWVKTLCCRHSFHFSCLEKLSGDGDKKKCPMCRGELDLKQLRPPPKPVETYFDDIVVKKPSREKASKFWHPSDENMDYQSSFSGSSRGAMPTTRNHYSFLNRR